MAVFGAAIGYWIAMAHYMRRVDQLYRQIGQLRDGMARDRLLRRLRG